MDTYNKILELSNSYEEKLTDKTAARVKEMEEDNNEHYLIYEVLGIPLEEGQLIDLYQNKGRFLYKYAGSYVEEAAIICFKEQYQDYAKKIYVPNTESASPKKFEIDCLINNKYAVEIKWRDATTDGDHISKEHRRVKAIKKAGFIPIRLMFFKPNRKQAIKIQKKLESLYTKEGGFYYSGTKAWEYVEKYTQINLYNMLKKISSLKINRDEEKETAIETILEKDED
ncbi:ApaLI family restriction endonuclease [Staphylococcus aureus]|uniref:ApaLI family restriction endonuclease n=1 Tax=Staphylococcus aureus TaxID=1280 RepID=UPI00208E1CAC|nr:ApaLI family restriction endonuclease [Staphylococcus aureus]UXT54666.1 ApaLI family restriction endonuclease [Staphylococcus aureus]UXV50359.1 ApaLI family restriction endonuclease [Staphylococcus aureus]HEE8915443.1 ApaLI family restriction endonuclease [Staphylococcus aureus]